MKNKSNKNNRDFLVCAVNGQIREFNGKNAELLNKAIRRLIRHDNNRNSGCWAGYDLPVGRIIGNHAARLLPWCLESVAGEGWRVV